MAGENLPIDFLSDHLETFEVGVKFVPGYGYLGIIRFNDKEVFRSGGFKSEAQIAFDHAVKFLEEKYQIAFDHAVKFLEEKYQNIMNENNIA